MKIMSTITTPHHTSSSFLTKYEIAKLVGIRAMQIEMTTIDNDPIQTAIQECENGFLPFNIRRHLPNGTSEEINISTIKHLKT